MDKVAIIIPVYNAGEFLKYSVESVLNQTYSNLEIILVNDGSKDNSGLLCDGYAEKDSRVKVIHKENGGLSSARNTGVENATADWIMFLDSDDYYDLKAVEYLVALRDKYAVDLVVTSIVEVRNYQTELNTDDISLGNSEKLDRYTGLVRMFYGNSVGTHPGGKLYKKEILLQYPYPEGMIYEDLAMAYEHIHYCAKIAVGYRSVYKYYRRMGSTVNSKYSERLLNFYKAMEWNRSYIERDYPNDKEMRRALNVRYVFNGLHVVHAMLSSGMYREINKIRKEYKQYFQDVMLNPDVTGKNKLKYLMLLVSPKLYEKIREKMG